MLSSRASIVRAALGVAVVYGASAMAAGQTAAQNAQPPAPVTVKLPEVGVCEADGEVRVALLPCDRKLPIVPWPLVSLEQKRLEVASPAKCQPAGASCFLDMTPTLWVQGVGRTATATFTSTAPPIDLGEVVLKDWAQLPDAVKTLTASLARSQRWTELAWRLGVPPNNALPLMRLTEKSPPGMIAFGTCDSQKVGTLSIADATLSIVAECHNTLRQPPAAFSSAFDRSKEPFTWNLPESVPAPDAQRPAASPLKVNWLLFPYNIESYQRDGAPVARQVVRPRSNSTKHLLAVSVTFVHGSKGSGTPPGTSPGPTPGTPPATPPGTPENHSVPISLITVWLTGFFGGVVAIVATALGGWLLRTRRARSMATSAGTRALMLVPPVLRKMFRDGIEIRPAANASGTSPVPLSDSSSPARDQKDEELQRAKELEQAQQPQRAKDAKEAQDAKDAKEAKEAKERQQARELKQAEAFENRFSQIEQTVSGLGKSLDTTKSTSAAAVTAQEGITKEQKLLRKDLDQLSLDLIGRFTTVEGSLEELVRSEVGKWKETIERARLAELQLEVVGSTDQDTKLDQPPPIDADSRKVLDALAEVTRLGATLHAAWIVDLGIHPRQRLARALAAAGRGVLLDDVVATAAALESTQSEYLLWKWWMGDVPSSAAVRTARRQWPLQPLDKASARRLAESWITARVSRIQTAIEAMPTELRGPDDAGIATALGAVARLLGLDTSRDAAPSAVSFQFHEATSHLYRVIGGEYFRVRLYDDMLSSPIVERFAKRKSDGFHYSAKSDVLIQTGLVDRHGVIVRVMRPLCRLTDGSNERWDGAVEYARVPEREG